ncbi:MAG: hypothetical protein K8T91_07360 [Planctomycetes bacterium]|nr:hypothetical protein [Planctomycetota bacterium]
MNSISQPESNWTTTVSTAPLILLTLVALAVWWGMHLYFSPRGRRSAWLVACAGLVLGSGALWLGLQALERVVVLDGLWRPALTAIAGAALIEMVVLIYRFERQASTPWTGRTILALRLAFIALLLVVLTEPTLTWKKTEPDERIVAVLMDDSTSMDQSDPQATPAEKLDLAELLLPGKVPSRIRPTKTSQSLRDLASHIATESAWLKQLAQTDAGTPSAEQFNQRREQAIANLRERTTALESRREEVTTLAAEAGMTPANKDALSAIANALSSSCGKVLSDTQKTLQSASLDRLQTDGAPLASQLDQATSALTTLADQLAQLDGAVAEATYQRLSPELRKSIDEAAGQSRRTIARVVAAERPEKKPALEQQLAGRYTVKIYRFAGTPSETTLASWSAPPKTAESAEQLIGRQRTDLAAAIEKIQTDIPRSLSGIVVVSDGRHNAKTLLEPVAHAVGLKNIPVASIIVGSMAPVVDAAVTTSSAPRSVQLSDRVTVRAGVKFVGLAGQAAEVTLTQAGQVVDTKKIQISSNDFRTELELADTPKKTGLASYKVQIAPLTAERSKENNVQDVYVQVTDDPIRLLLIEGRPRWEYRYLRNLFADRDKSVRLQHVLMHPEKIEGSSATPLVNASATRPHGEAEASALPAKAEDWFLFDTIILGDVSPQELGTEAVDILKRFVIERGGRLIVIAGNNSMPHAFTSSPLAEMLPVTVAPSTTAIKPPSEPGYYVRLAPEGDRHTVTQLENNPEDNRILWESLPEQHLRYPIQEAKPGASVLAFAMPFDVPEVFRRTAGTPEEAEQLAQQRKEFMSRNAVLAVQPFGSGQVLFLGFDGTWRFRYRTGDTHHHRFWGQVMRWATTEKLPVGTDVARFGTDRPVYEAGESVITRARLRDKSHAAVTTKGASVVVQEGKREVLRKRLDPLAGSPGMYESDLGPLPPGKEYRVSLAIDDPAKPELAAAANQISTQIVVTQPQSLELSDFSADRITLELLARRTGGVVVSPGESDKVLEVLGPVTREVTHEERFPLWHSSFVLLSLLGLVATEWIVRKKGGLT